MSHIKIWSTDPGVCPVIDGNQIQDDGRSSHLGWAAELIIERNLPLVTPNKPQKNRINRLGRLSYTCYWRKPNVYGHRRIGHDKMLPTFYDRGHKDIKYQVPSIQLWHTSPAHRFFMYILSVTQYSVCLVLMIESTMWSYWIEIISIHQTCYWGYHIDCWKLGFYQTNQCLWQHTLLLLGYTKFRTTHLTGHHCSSTLWVFSNGLKIIFKKLKVEMSISISSLKPLKWITPSQTKSHGTTSLFPN
jgi:hypothetical protein